MFLRDISTIEELEKCKDPNIFMRQCTMDQWDPAPGKTGDNPIILDSDLEDNS